MGGHLLPAVGLHGVLPEGALLDTGAAAAHAPWAGSAGPSWPYAVAWRWPWPGGKTACTGAARKGRGLAARTLDDLHTLARPRSRPWSPSPHKPWPLPVQEAGRLDQCVQALVNPSDEALFNLRTAMSNQSELRVLEVLAESDEVRPSATTSVAHSAGMNAARRRLA